MNRSIAGRRAKSQGDSWEQRILEMPRPPHVHLQRTSPPWRYVKQGNTLKVVVTEVGVPDFHGHINGAFFAFDAKRTEKDRWPLRDLSPEQAEHFVLARLPDRVGVMLDLCGEVWWLPWSGLCSRWQTWNAGSSARGEASLTANDCNYIGRRVQGMRWWEVIG